MLNIVTYDLDAGWDEVRDAAFKLGFFNIIETTSGDRISPNTTLFTNNLTPASVLSLFGKAVENAEAKLGRTINVLRIFTGRVSADWLILSENPK